MSEMRVLVWYSDGAASAVAAKLAVDKYGERVTVLKCDTTGDEHPDNLRFRRDVEAWMGRDVILIKSQKYSGIDDVFESARYMAGIAGARCTTELKKIPRRDYERANDIHIFGYTLDEGRRIRRFEANAPELDCEWILRDNALDKSDCLLRLNAAGIKLPAMYKLGFNHNNCIGCVKATSPYYWSRTRTLFPEVFARRVAQSRDLGVRLARVKGERVFLDEIPLDFGGDGPDGDIECGPFCEVQGSLSLEIVEEE
jgi:3'-phosphoadenosine 5'-phosphosulfate sulfotransferase (PAPS reductase)/FAD synthetase